MRFFNNIFSMLEGPSFPCGLVCLAAHLNSHDSNRNIIAFFRLGGLKKSLHTLLFLQPSDKLLRALFCRVLKTSKNGECTTLWATMSMLDWCHSDLFFPLKSECPHVSVASHPDAVHLSRECCCIFLIISGTRRKLLGFLSSLLTECSSLSLSSQGMCSHTNLTALSCTHCNLSTSFS